MAKVISPSENPIGKYQILRPKIIFLSPSAGGSKGGSSGGDQGSGSTAGSWPTDGQRIPHPSGVAGTSL